MLVLRIDPRSHIPIYLQIVDGIRTAVAAGVFLPGEAIPTLKAMSLKAHVNPNTVQKAYDELAREGVIYSQRGKGLFVAENGKAAAQTSAREAVQRAFLEGVRSGRSAGMSLKEIRSVFTAALEESSKKGAEV